MDLLGKKMKKITITELASFCGLRTADCGLRTVDCGLMGLDCGYIRPMGDGWEVSRSFIQRLQV